MHMQNIQQCFPLYTFRVFLPHYPNWLVWRNIPWRKLIKLWRFNDSSLRGNENLSLNLKVIIQTPIKQQWVSTSIQRKPDSLIFDLLLLTHSIITSWAGKHEHLLSTSVYWHQFTPFWSSEVTFFLKLSSIPLWRTSLQRPGVALNNFMNIQP